MDSIKKFAAWLGLQNMGLKSKMELQIGGVVLFALLASGAVTYWVLQKDLDVYIQAELQNTNNIIFRSVSNQFRAIIKTKLGTISERSLNIVEFYYKQYKDGKISRKEAEAAIRTILLDKKFGKVGLTGYVAVLTDASIVAIHPHIPKGKDLSKVEFVRKASQMKDGYLEYKWKNKGERVARTKAAYLRYFEPWHWVIWATSYKNEFQELLLQDGLLQKSLYGIQIGKTGHPYIFDKDGNLILHPTLKGKNIYDLADARGHLFIQEMLRKKNGSIRYYWPLHKGDDASRLQIAYFRELPDVNWIIASSAYQDEYYSILSSLKIVIFFVMLFTITALFLVLSYRVNRLLKPLAYLSRKAQDYAEGDFRSEIKVRSRDEIGDLSGVFNRLIHNFRELLAKIKETALAISAAIQDMNVSSKEIAATSNQQAAAVKEIVATMEDNDEASKSIARRIQEVAKIAFETKSMVDKGYAHIRNLAEGMQEIKATNDDVAKGVKDLNLKIETIWDIVNIINSIADQTKIIAFNAELESTAAGEYGKNFKIVAAEIRRLADNTASSTREIKEKIEEIQNSSDRLIISSEEGARKIDLGLSSSEDVVQTFNTILESAEISSESSEKISQSVRQQVSAFEQILLTLRQISEGIDNFVESTKSMTHISEKLKDMAGNLSGSMEKYRT